MRIKSQRDFLTGLLFVVFGVLSALAALDRPIGPSAQMSAGFLPLWLGVLLATLGAVLGFKAMTIERDGGDRIGALAWRPLLGVLGALLAFGWLVPRIGIVLTVPVVVGLAGAVGARASWRACTVLAAVLVALVFGALWLWPDLPLPVWPGSRV